MSYDKISEYSVTYKIVSLSPSQLNDKEIKAIQMKLKKQIKNKMSTFVDVMLVKSDFAGKNNSTWLKSDVAVANLHIIC